MAEKLQIYKCMVCGNIVEVFHGGVGELVCCGQPMENLVAKTADEGKEKHVPVIEKIDGGFKVKVGSVAHPMSEVRIQNSEFSVLSLLSCGYLLHKRQQKEGNRVDI